MYLLQLGCNPVAITQSLRDMSTRETSWRIEVGWWVGLTTLPPSCANCHKIWNP